MDFERAAFDLGVELGKTKWIEEKMALVAAALRSAYERGAKEERAKAFTEAADYVLGYAQAVRQAGHIDSANTLISVMTSIQEMATRARGER